MRRRAMLIITSLLTAVIILTSVAVWLFLSSWMPTKGKALLVTEVERYAPVTLSIGSLRYRFFQGLILERVRVVDRATHAVWATVPAMHIRVDWLGLLLRTHVGFTGRATLETPCETAVAFSGRSDSRRHTLALDIRTDDMSIRSLSPPLTTSLPPGITDGTVRLNAHLAQSADAALTITGRIMGTHLVWTGPMSHVKADLVIDGTAWPPRAPAAPWTYDAKVTMRNGSVDGIPRVGVLTDIRGSAHATAEQLQIHELIGRMLDAPWNAEGFIAMGPTPALELHWTSSMPLAPLAAAMAPLVAPWQLEGGADIAAVCRGPLMPSPMLDCLLRADLRRVTLDGLLLARPVTDLTGRLTYDLLAHRVSLDHVSGQLADHPLTVDGTVALTSPMQFGLAIEGVLPLEFVLPWLPASTPLTRLGGVAAVTLRLEGTSNAPVYDGTVELREAVLQWTQPAITVEHLGGMIRLTRERLAAPQITCQVNGQPLSITGMLFPMEGPRVNGTITFPRGTLALAAHATPAQLIIDSGTLSMTKSRLMLRGALDRSPDPSGTMEFSGGLELAELSSAPFLSLPQLEAWQPQGLIEMNGRFTGSLANWTAATIHARAQSDALRLRNVPVQDLRGSFDQERGSLRIAIPSALVAGGRFQSDFTIDHRASAGRFHAEADLLGLQLAQLRESIPQWKARNVTGIASSHAVAAGMWPDRSTWIGEGWLNASGEHLGEWPLLEKLFQGLFGVLADQLGLDMLRRADITQASLHWRLAKERFETDDLRLGGMAGTEPMAVYAKGSVGFNQTLDFVIDPELSESTLLQAPTTSSLAGVLLKAVGKLETLRRLVGRHRLTGTIKQPDYRFQVGRQELLQEMDPTSPTGLLQDIMKTLR